MKIALDYGHCLNGADTGATGNGYKEEECTREIGKSVKIKLEALGHTVIAVAPDSASSVSSSLSIRVNNCPSDADLFVSIHLNAGGGVGTEVYTYKAKELVSAGRVLNNIVSIGFADRGIKDGSNLYVINNTPCDSMLIELCFIDSSSDMSKYASNKENLAYAIAYGISNIPFSAGGSGWNLGWNQDSTGWWYCTDNVNKYYYKDSWQQIDGEWYSFDSDGYARESTWIQDGGKWYYLKSSCAMAKSEWLWIDDECYCFNEHGELYVDTITPDGYRVDETGAWVQ